MAGDRILKVIIAGDAKGALGAFSEMEAGAEGMGAKMATVAAAVPLVFAAAAVGVGGALFKIGSDFDEAYDNIRVKTGATGDALEGLKDDFRAVVTTVPTDFGKAGDAIAGVKQKLDLTGAPLQQVSEQFLELSRITKTDLAGNLGAGTDALNNWGVAAGDQSAVLDELFRASQQSGQSFGDLAAQLASNGPVLRDLGLNIDDATGFLATLGKAGVDTSDVMPALSKSLASAAKDGVSAGDLFKQTFDKIKNSSSDTEAAGDALQVFGAKAGPKLAGLIREGKLSYEQMTAAIKGGNDTILGAGKDTQDFGEKWELIKNKVLVGLEPLATAVFDGVGKAMDNLGPFIDNMSVKFEGIRAWVELHWPEIQKAITDAVEKVQAIVTPIVDTLTTLWDNFGDNILQFVKDSWGPVQDIIDGAMTAIQGIIETISALIKGDWEGVWTGIKDFVDGIWTAIQGIIGEGIAVVQGIVGVGMEIVTGIFSGAWDAIQTGVSTAFDNVIGFVGDMPGRIANAASGMWDGITSAFRSAINALIDAWNGLEFDIPGFGVGPLSFGGFTLGVPDIPHIAKGGVTMGPTLAMIGDNRSGRELVVPLERAGELGFGGGGTVVYLTVHAGMGVDGPRLAQQIMEALEQGARNGVKPGRNTVAAFAS